MKRVTLILAFLAAVATAAPLPSTSAAQRHSGTVTSIDARAGVLTIVELAEEGKPRTIRMTVGPQARILLSEPLPVDQIADLAHAFKDTPIGLSDIRPGDFVTVEISAAATPEAASITVSLRKTPQ